MFDIDNSSDRSVGAPVKMAPGMCCFVCLNGCWCVGSFLRLLCIPFAFGGTFVFVPLPVSLSPFGLLFVVEFALIAQVRSIACIQFS